MQVSGFAERHTFAIRHISHEVEGLAMGKVCPIFLILLIGVFPVFARNVVIHADVGEHGKVCWRCGSGGRCHVMIAENAHCDRMSGGIIGLISVCSSGDRLLCTCREGNHAVVIRVLNWQIILALAGGKEQGCSKIYMELLDCHICFFVFFR